MNDFLMSYYNLCESRMFPELPEMKLSKYLWFAASTYLGTLLVDIYLQH